MSFPFLICISTNYLSFFVDFDRTLVLFFLVCAGEITSIESVPDLQKLMYVAVDGYPCVRLLNLSGEIGCSSKILLLFD